MKKIKTGYLASAIGCLVVVIGIVCYFLFAGIAKKEGTSYLFIDDDDDMDSVSVKLSEIATPTGVCAVALFVLWLVTWAMWIRSAQVAISSTTT